MIHVLNQFQRRRGSHLELAKHRCLPRIFWNHKAGVGMAERDSRHTQNLLVLSSE